MYLKEMLVDSAIHSMKILSLSHRVPYVQASWELCCGGQEGQHPQPDPVGAVGHALPRLGGYHINQEE